MYTSNATRMSLNFQNSLNQGYVGISDQGNFGLWATNANEWVIRMATNKDIYMGVWASNNGNVYCRSYFNVKHINGYDTASGLTISDNITVRGISNVNLSCNCIDGSNNHVLVFANTAFRPTNADKSKITLGNSSIPFKQLFASTSTISTSDRNMKKDVHKLTDVHKEFFMKLIPVSYLFKDGESGRTHIGFISQDVEVAMKECGMTDLDFAGFCKDVKMKGYYELKNGEKNEVLTEDLDKDGNLQYIYSLRYEEFIGIIAYVLQDTVNRTNKLEEKLDELYTV